MQHTPTHRPRVPLALIAAAVISVVIFLGSMLAWVAWNMALELRIFIGAAFAGAVAWLYAGVVVYLRKHDMRLLEADKVIGLTLAQRSQGLPASITSLNYHDSHRIESAPPALALPEPQNGQIVQIPTFAQLLDSGAVGPNKPLILGYNADTGMAISGSWKDLYSCGIGAQQGAGKTWLLAFLLAQSAAAGGRLIICDLHAGDDESLANRIGALAPAFMCDIASTPKEIETAFAFADDKLEKRKGSTARWPIVIVADEWTSLLRTSAGANLPTHIQNIAEQGRKFGVNGLLAAQAWTKDASSAVRNQLTSHYVLRQRPDEARYQLGLRAANLPDDIRSLPDATAYLLNVKGELIKVVIPKMTNADIARAGEMIEVHARALPTFGFTAPTAPLTPLVAEWKPKGSALEAPAGSASTPTARVKTVSAEAAHAYGLFMAGKAPSEIAEALRGVKASAGGRAYQKALTEVYDLIREGGQS
jgi:hypothetical protein